MNGYLLINKPKDLSSRDTVNLVCKYLNRKDIGHLGTLDPFAEGLLVLVIGKALKTVKLINNSDKTYIAKAETGFITDTLDIKGKVIKKREENIDKEEMEKVFKSFIGKFTYEAPKYSAIKVNGERLYKLAREGKDIKSPLRESYIYSLDLISIEKSSFTFITKVSSGTYIRSLVNEISKSLDKYMTLTKLIRTEVGDFKLKDSYTLEDIKEGSFKLLNVEEVFKPKVININNMTLLNKIKNGNKINYLDNKLILYRYKDEDLALYKEGRCLSFLA